MSQSEEIRATLVYHRRNRTQTELAESFGVCQSSICRAISRWTPRIAEALEDFIPTVEDLDPSHTLIVDGTLVTCWNWKNQPALYSGKHHHTGLNLQVACDLTGRLAWVSDPTPGATHDTKALRLTGLLEHFPNTPPVADKGYTGLGMITPERKPVHGELTENQKQYNRTINKLRAPVERAIPQPQNLANTPHRLPQTHPHLPTNHHNSHRTRILQKQFCITLRDRRGRCAGEGPRGC
ncbi:transposase family protein [Propionibacterium australiense]|uniref:transposase family protein n=1 Tax=Propionibacterium australiense TaxID=119981 RepID=UPI0018D5731A|nr:transposase family protein [Propionibacterium australiense]